MEMNLVFGTRRGETWSDVLGKGLAGGIGRVRSSFDGDYRFFRFLALSIASFFLHHHHSASIRARSPR